MLKGRDTRGMNFPDLQEFMQFWSLFCNSSLFIFLEVCQLAVSSTMGDYFSFLPSMSLLEVYTRLEDPGKTMIVLKQHLFYPFRHV